jgi:S-adenosylmethionine decarboxylase
VAPAAAALSGDSPAGAPSGASRDERRRAAGRPIGVQAPSGAVAGRPARRPALPHAVRVAAADRSARAARRRRGRRRRDAGQRKKRRAVVFFSCNALQRTLQFACVKKIFSRRQQRHERRRRGAVDGRSTARRVTGLNALGRHLLLELFDCDSDAINNLEAVKTALVEAAKRAQATIVDVVFHEFNPFGVSGVVVIAESHLSIHTWPEYRYAAVDIFSCGDVLQPEIAANYLVEQFGAERTSVVDVQRGLFLNPAVPIVNKAPVAAVS